MCILCVIQKWSRKVATMLPWLVIPVIGLWLLSQFLPPAYRFEITLTRLACVLVLLINLFWYEILMPQLSSWRARRNARIMERMRLEAIELQKLRKYAIRRCRNCRTPYQDQNPLGGKFKCFSCGHNSKRPDMGTLESPVLGQLSNSGMIRDLVRKVWFDTNWICGQDWLEDGSDWVNGSFFGKSSYWKKSSDSFFSSASDHFLFFLLVFVCKSSVTIFMGIMWLFRNLYKISFDEDETSPDSDINGIAKRGENGVNRSETRSEKARRKAEEKRQARLEREQLEEEERKQREEVSRLVEERRKLRNQYDKHNRKGKASLRDKTDKKEAERNHQERKKERDRGSSKRNNDIDEPKNRASKESEKNRKAETDYREHYRSRAVMPNSYTQGSVGSGYLDRMRGNFFTSSKTLSQGGFFGKGTNANASNTREYRSSSSVDHTDKREFVQPEHAHVKPKSPADDQYQNHASLFESQPCPPPKRSWKQLFTRSLPTTSSTSANVVSRTNGNLLTKVQGSIASGCPLTQGFNIPVTHGLPNPSQSRSYENSSSSTAGLQLSTNLTELLPKEPENFEDPCYAPNPSNLTEPVSESLGGLQSFLVDFEFEKPSPIESLKGKIILPSEDHGTANEKEWQMWGSSPLEDTLSLVVGFPNWYLPQELNGSRTEGVTPLQPQTACDTNGDPWSLRTSYGSMLSNSNRLSLEGTTHNNLGYGIPNGSAFNHQFQLSHASVWPKNEEAAAPDFVEGVGTTSAMIPPPGFGITSTQM